MVFVVVGGAALLALIDRLTEDLDFFTNDSKRIINAANSLGRDR